MKQLAVSQIATVRGALLRRQGMICAICPQPLTVHTSCLDHCHTTGRIRGVLCRNCNGLEGKMNIIANRGRRNLDRTEYLTKVVEYWLHHKTDRVGVLHPTFKTVDEKRLLVNKRARVKRAKAKVVKGK